MIRGECRPKHVVLKANNVAKLMDDDRREIDAAATHCEDEVVRSDWLNMDTSTTTPENLPEDCNVHPAKTGRLGHKRDRLW